MKDSPVLYAKALTQLIFFIKSFLLTRFEEKATFEMSKMTNTKYYSAACNFIYFDDQNVTSARGGRNKSRGAVRDSLEYVCYGNRIILESDGTKDYFNELCSVIKDVISRDENKKIIKRKTGLKTILKKDIPGYYVEYFSNYGEENEPSAKPAINNTDVTNNEPVTPQILRDQTEELNRHLSAKSGKTNQENKQ